MTNPAAQSVATSSVMPIAASGGDQTWQRTWQLFDHTGAFLRAAIEVDDANDETVIVRVGRIVVHQSVPPWIKNRTAGISVADTVDRKQRADYFDTVVESIRVGLITDLNRRRVIR